MANCVVFETRSERDLVNRVDKLVCSHDFRISGKRRRLNARWSHAVLHNIEINYFRYGVAAAVDTREPSPSLLIEIPLTGESRTQTGGADVDSGPGRAVLADMGRRLHTELSEDCSKLLLRIPNSALESYLETRLGSMPTKKIRFEPLMQLTGGYASSFAHILDFVLAEFDAPHSILHRDPAFARQIENMLLYALFTEQSNNYSEQLLTPRGPEFLQRVEEFVNAHCDEDLTVDRLAAVANVSARKLFDGFQRFRKVSPIRYVKETRLNKIHDALLSADCRRATVTDIASRWGISQFGRFAVEYRSYFGESPSVTLRRSSPEV